MLDAYATKRRQALAADADPGERTALDPRRDEQEADPAERAERVFSALGSPKLGRQVN